MWSRKGEGKQKKGKKKRRKGGEEEKKKNGKGKRKIPPDISNIKNGFERIHIVKRACVRRTYSLLEFRLQMNMDRLTSPLNTRNLFLQVYRL